MKDSLKQWAKPCTSIRCLRREYFRLKVRYFLKNIERFNQIASTIKVSRGSSWNKDILFWRFIRSLTARSDSCNFRIILITMMSLLSHAENSKHNQWVCEECLKLSEL